MPCCTCPTAGSSRSTPRVYRIQTATSAPSVSMGGPCHGLSFAMTRSWPAASCVSSCSQHPTKGGRPVFAAAPTPCRRINIETPLLPACRRSWRAGQLRLHARVGRSRPHRWRGQPRCRQLPGGEAWGARPGTVRGQLRVVGRADSGRLPEVVCAGWAEVPAAVSGPAPGESGSFLVPTPSRGAYCTTCCRDWRLAVQIGTPLASRASNIHSRQIFRV